MENLHQGGCLCGAVRFETTGIPDQAQVCHCRACQLRTGSAFGIGVYFLKEKFSLLSGKLDTYKYFAQCGCKIAIDRCTDCGTPLIWRTNQRQEIIGTAGGSYDPPTFWFELSTENFIRSKAKFCMIDSPLQNNTSPTYNPQIHHENRLDGENSF